MEALASLITPTQLAANRIGFLLELHESIVAAAPRFGFEWVIAVDGAVQAELPESIAKDRRVRVIRTGRSVGAAGARNLALATVNTRFVTSVDDDDLLPQNSLDHRVEALLAYPECGWCAGLLTDLFADGSTSVWDCPAKRGDNKPGDVWRAWGEPEGIFPFGPTTMLALTESVKAVGGWQGLPQGEDFGLVMAITSSEAGHMLDESVYLYRKHSEQMTRTHDFDELESTVRAITFERGRVLAARAS